MLNVLVPAIYMLFTGKLPADYRQITGKLRAHGVLNLLPCPKEQEGRHIPAAQKGIILVRKCIQVGLDTKSLKYCSIFVPYDGDIRYSGGPERWICVSSPPSEATK